MVVIPFMASIAGVWRISIVAGMAKVTIVGNIGMCPGQRIIIVMDRESCRLPTWICRVTGFTGNRYSQCCMAGVRRLIIIANVTIRADSGGPCVAIYMAFRAGRGDMGPCQGEI